MFVGADQCTKTYCGRSGISTSTLTLGGTYAKEGELPWLAIVYTKDLKPFKQICSGTIIAPALVLSGTVFTIVGIRPRSQSVKHGLLPPSDDQGHIHDFTAYSGNHWRIDIDAANATTRFHFLGRPTWRVTLPYFYDHPLSSTTRSIRPIIAWTSIWVQTEECASVRQPGYGTALCDRDGAAVLMMDGTTHRYYLRGIFDGAYHDQTGCSSMFTHIRIHELFIDEQLKGALLPATSSTAIPEYEYDPGCMRPSVTTKIAKTTKPTVSMVSALKRKMRRCRLEPHPVWNICVTCPTPTAAGGSAKFEPNGTSVTANCRAPNYYSNEILRVMSFYCQLHFNESARHLTVVFCTGPGTLCALAATVDVDLQLAEFQ
ncbi:hypothetical protein EVAR_46150_1 [Eumeta japonica]|uniref:Uncharacterized protein n=1 Tax=Eumeta variegata TaxID=151549 RepID=A0A4C2AF98_EUMVA|nr:hypothetical protein EVAR_46150_1 [Eumeta japonica]